MQCSNHLGNCCLLAYLPKGTHNFHLMIALGWLNMYGHLVDMSAFLELIYQTGNGCWKTPVWFLQVQTLSMVLGQLDVRKRNSNKSMVEDGAKEMRKGDPCFFSLLPIAMCLKNRGATPFKGSHRNGLKWFMFVDKVVGFNPIEKYVLVISRIGSFPFISTVLG